ncbi:MAG: hypothetical protein A3A33_04605 [Candidatus Yanofskybacteria bacterium RIFCSPLOWO2_01_FULL_49_25]|uniref:Uncharacterized protein n=1 Tax=Candidatus Yanofskybacteria bacterium RIFCSPLOWO2_01_FULL_49_25 TaxID=1802701 RepID=A0A1F8GTC2_9BACT|nr:MAG: hypothetical protein A3A33_04605 [Candidatus Yanofskybacteria bacterium RIFCSPLOWO2_01_FULL_49_25]
MSDSKTGPIFDKEPGWGHSVSKWLNRYLITHIAPILIGALIIGLYVRYLPARKSPADPTVSTSPSPTDQQTAWTSDAIRRGDSYTSIARAIVNRVLMIEQTGTITRGARLYAETKLVQDIKAQPLVVGGTLSYSQPAVFDYLYGFDKLSPAQKAKWESYARYIKF